MVKGSATMNIFTNVEVTYLWAELGLQQPTVALDVTGYHAIPCDLYNFARQDRYYLFSICAWRYAFLYVLHV